MAMYENEKSDNAEDESAEYTGKDLGYKEKYDDHDKVLNLLSSAQQAESDDREDAREAHLFVDKKDGQWEPKWWTANENKPRYTFDQVSPIVSQITSEIEQADFDIRISPAGGDATKDLAATYDGIIRNVENLSNATQVYAQACRGMITSGFDAWRVSQKYADDNSFDQDLIIEKIANPIDRVWFDPSAELQDKSDSRYAFVLHPMAPDEFEARFPDGAGESVSEDRDGDAYYDKAEAIVVAEFLYLESEDRELVMMSNGKTYEVDEEFKKVADELEAIGVTEIKRRTRKAHRVCSRYFDAKDWLEEKKDTVFNRINVVPVYGNFKIFENKTIFYGAVKKLLDPQRVLNYALSREIEEGALAPRAKYWMTPAQAAGHEDTLQTLNTNADPVQFYNPDPEMPSIPQQQGGAQINSGLRTISQAMQGMMSSSSGLFAANMGDNPNAQSGVAVTALQNKGDNATFHYTRAMEIAIAATGRLLKDAIPKVYDTQRIVRVLREDDSYDLATINETIIDQQTGQLVTLNDLSQGIYDVICKVGPSFRNRQQETVQAITSLAAVDPSIMQVAGDLLLQNIETPAAAQISERKRAQMLAQGVIPENQLTDEEKEARQQAMMQAQGQQPPDANMVMAQAEQLKAQAEMLKAQIDQEKLNNERMKLQLEARKLQVMQANDQADNQIDGFRAETDRMNTQVKAEQAGATIDMSNIKSFGEELNNQQKIMQLQEKQRIQQEAEMREMLLSLSPSELEIIANGG
jgi:hypothetical protein